MTTQNISNIYKPGKALAITGANPLYSANGPSFLINCLNTSPIPLYFPSGAVCSRLLRTSCGMPTAQLDTPAIPPANTVPRNSRECDIFSPSGTDSEIFFLMNSYVRKYIPEAGTSVDEKKLRRFE